MNTPTESGYYWYKEIGWGWEIELVYRDLETKELKVHSNSFDDDVLVEEYIGTWNNKLEPPDSDLDGELIEKGVK